MCGDGCFLHSRQFVTGAGIDRIATWQRCDQTHVHVDMRTSHHGADDAVDGGFHTIDRQLESTREVIAGTGSYDAQWLAAATDRIRTQCDHAVAADHHQIVVFVPTTFRLNQGVLETRARHIDDFETVPVPGGLQQADHLFTGFCSTAFVRCRVPHHGNGHIRM